MADKKAIINKMGLTGLDRRYINMVMDIPFQLYDSTYSIINGKSLNFKWYADQLRQYLKGNINLAGKYAHICDKGYNNLEAIRHNIITDSIKRSMIDSKPVLGIIEDKLWDMVEYILLVYDNFYTDKDDTYWNSISAGEIMGFFLNRKKQPLIFKLEEAFYKLAEQIMSLVVISDNNIKISDVGFGYDLHIDIGCLVTHNKYDVKIGRFGTLDIKRVGYNKLKSVYSIVKVELDSIDKLSMTYGGYSITYGQLNNTILGPVGACSINSIDITRYNGNLARLILVNHKDIDSAMLNRVLDRHFVKDTYKIVQMDK